MIKSERPDLAILVVSIYDDNPSIMGALRAGALGYCLKGEDVTDLLSGLRQVLAGGKYLTARLKDRPILQVFLDAHSPVLSAIKHLTRRETEVLELIGQGLGSRQIAERLGMSVKTVETHRGHIKEKLSLTDARDLVRFAKDWIGGMNAI